MYPWTRFKGSRGGILIESRPPSAREPETPPQPPPAVKGPPRAFVRWAAILVIVILIAGLSVAVWYSSYVGAPYEVGTLAAGEQTVVLLPVMTFYSLPSFGPKGTSETSVSFTNTTFLDFVWGNVTGTDLPVHFTIRPNATGSAAFESSVANGFRLWPSPGGSLGVGVLRPSRQEALVFECALNYTVRRMARQVGFGSESWLDVDYMLWTNVTDIVDLPFANVTAPTTVDLAWAGNETVDLIAPWQVQRSLANFTKPATPFRHTVGPIVLSLGSAGNLTADLTSSFTWGPNDRYEILLGGRRDTTLTLIWYWDTRFGSLIAM